MKVEKITLIIYISCLISGLFIHIFFDCSYILSLYITAFLLADIAIIFYTTKLRKLHLIWFVIISFLTMLSLGNLITGIHKKTSIPETINAIIKNSEKYEGTRYRYGGTTKNGMDCSGLIRTIFKEEHIHLPRASSEMAKIGDRIALEDVKIGDLLFFRTLKTKKTISHVGLVTTIEGDDIAFIHSTTNQGVITSKLKEKYWNKTFAQARRIL